MKNKIHLLPAGMIVGVTAFIFSNSLKGSEASHKDSDVILSWVRPFLDWIAGGDLEKLSYIVRKAAHMTEFCVLALLIGWLSYTLCKNFHGYGVFYTLAVAVTDEFIQSFSDRTSQILDVLIDFSGALIGFGLVFLIKIIIKRKKNGD